ncbi:MAG TPA: NADH dehydrogenase (quinone) subunit D [Chloroflexota bacterium]|jgi:NADH-quinone oxidoreductase subunit D
MTPETRITPSSDGRTAVLERPDTRHEGDLMTVNMGPQHPSTHGVLRIILTLDGETVVDAVPDIGFLHTGIEKSIQWKRYEAALTCTDRMDYLSPLSNNLGYCLAVEKLLGLEIPPRATWLRVMLVELQRIASHLVWLGTHALDLGAMTVFLYCFREREIILDLFEELTGQRMMTSYIRFGGVELEVPDGWLDRVHAFIDPFPNRVDEYERLLTRNGIWKERLTGVGVISGQEAIEWGLNGPSLRGSGIARDLRRQEPYLVYDQLKFDVPVRAEGDCYARYLVRVAEMRQTREIVVQCLKNLPGGPIRSDDRKVVPPPKEELANSMEAVIHHFKLLTEGLKPPIGEVYQAIESPRGELGFYLVSDGSNRPRRCHVRAPSFANLQALPRLCRGHLVADVVAIIGSIDIVLGEIDR